MSSKKKNVRKVGKNMKKRNKKVIGRNRLIANTEEKRNCLLQIKNIDAARAVKVDNANLKDTIRFCLAVLNGDERETDELIETVFHKYSENRESRKVVGISFSITLDMVLINFIFTDEKDPVDYEDLANGAMAFGYVYNITCPAFSEFGYIGYKNYIRVY